MRPGPLIRRLFGPYERQVAEAYKRLFVDLDDFADLLRLWVPHPGRILEGRLRRRSGGGATCHDLCRRDHHWHRHQADCSAGSIVEILPASPFCNARPTMSPGATRHRLTSSC